MGVLYVVNRHPVYPVKVCVYLVMLWCFIAYFHLFIGYEHFIAECTKTK